MPDSGPLLVINKKIFDASSMATDLTSEVIEISQISGFCVHAIWTGAPVGNVIVYGSNHDNDQGVAVSTPVATGGVDGQLLLNVEKAHYKYMSVIFDRTSGTGSLDCWVSGKNV